MKSPRETRRCSVYVLTEIGTGHSPFGPVVPEPALSLSPSQNKPLASTWGSSDAPVPTADILSRPPLPDVMETRGHKDRRSVHWSRCEHRVDWQDLIPFVPFSLLCLVITFLLEFTSLRLWGSTNKFHVGRGPGNLSPASRSGLRLEAYGTSNALVTCDWFNRIE
jgi:hypothetical protein